MEKSRKNTTSGGGKTQRVYLFLREGITSGMYAPGAALPGELKLAERFAVSRVTIRRALDELVADGLVKRRAGSGTIVRTQKDHHQTIVADFATLMPDVVAMGLATTARLLDFSYCVPPPRIAAALLLKPEGRVQRAVRVRTMEGTPFSHLTTHVPEDVAQNYSEADLATTPLFRLLERSGVQVDHSTQIISATHAQPDVAEALGVAAGSALIALTRVVFDAQGSGVEHLIALYRPDRYRLEMTLDRVGEQGARRWSLVTKPQGLRNSTDNEEAT